MQDSKHCNRCRKSGSMSRPEYTAPAEIFYDSAEASKYTFNTRIQKVQAEMTLRALQLLNLSPGSFLLDIGCGSGLTGEILTEEGFNWVGLDISASMLGEALDREIEGDLFLADMGNGFPFRAGTFEAAISISAIQWLCNADSSFVNPSHRLNRFFRTLFACLVRGGKAVCQFYPSDQHQVDAISHAARVAGFSGGIIIDNETSVRRRKYYLVIVAGQSDNGFNLTGVQIFEDSTAKRKKIKETRKEYIARKKELMRKRGKDVASESKYSGRKRKPKF